MAAAIATMFAFCFPGDVGFGLRFSFLLHMQNNADILHVMGGIPSAYTQNPQQTWWLNNNKDEKWVPVELTAGGHAIGEKLVDSTVFEIEVVRAKQ